MSIQFDSIPNNIRVPGVYVETNSSRRNSGRSQTNKRILVIGQRLTTGTVAQAIPTLVTSKEQAITFFGRGSMLADMFNELFNNNPFTEKWACALDDNGAGAAAAGTLTVTGPATASGTINLYVGGVLVQAAVASGDAQNTIAAAINTAINAASDLPVTSTVSTNVVTVTFRHKGLVGNYHDMRLNYRGVNGGESTPAGVAVAIVQLTGGTSNPDIATAIAALPEEIYDYWLIPYRDSTSIGKIDTEMDSRNGPLRALEGYTFAAASDTVSNLVTLGSARNKQYVSIFDAGYNSPKPAYLQAAELCGQASYAASIDPARPFNTLTLIGNLAEPDEDRRSLTENNTLLYSGIATRNIANDGAVQIGRLISTYQKNPAGQADASWLDANVALTLSDHRQSWRARIRLKYPRHKLGNSGQRFGLGQQIVTLDVI
jgi:phage tail sheath gpL-like